MVQIELEGGLILEVPLKSHMKAQDFLEVVEKLERFHKVEQPGHSNFKIPPTPKILNPPIQVEPVVAPPVQEPVMQSTPTQLTPDDFKLPSEDLIKVQHLTNQVRSHMDYIKRHEDAIARHDKHLGEILEYLQSLDKHLRR